MKIYSSSSEFDPGSGVSYLLTIGTFDGVHVGHRKILSDLKMMAKERQAEIVLLTFFPHPRIVLNERGEGFKMINTMDEKERLLEELGVDHLVIQAFDEKFSEMSPYEFVADVIVKDLQTSCLVIGYDHRFGKNREGSFELLSDLQEEFGYELKKIPKQLLEDVTVSSTAIREALREGDIEQANELLGSVFTLSGTVIKGNELGREIGYPTANLEIAEHYKLIPANGVYAVKVQDLEDLKHEPYNGMLNIGVRPTVDGKELRVEVHLLDYSGNLYGHKLRLSFVKRIRNEEKFESLEALKDRIKEDEKLTRELFSI